MTVLFTNNASGALASSINASATTIVLASGQGAEFPLPSGGSYFYATLTDTSNNLEIVKVTARTADTLTVARGQDTTVARSYNAGDLLELRPVAAAFTDMQAFPPSGSIAASTLVEAIQELDTETPKLSANNTFSGTNTISGNFSGTFTGNLVGNADTATNATTANSAVKLTSTNYSIEESGGNLLIKYGSTTIATITSAGNITATGNITSGT